MTPIQKHQFIRVLDVILIGPLMIYAAQKGQLSLTVRNALLFFGVSTIIYNGRNYLLQRAYKDE